MQRRRRPSGKLSHLISREKIYSGSFPVIFVIGELGKDASNCPPLTLLRRGLRFQYTFYYPAAPPSDKQAVRLSRANAPSSDLSRYPIHSSIRALDHEAMELLTMPPATACMAHHDFTEYLRRTKNTICGRHPIGILLGALSVLEKEGRAPSLAWVRYEQSSECRNVNDSSVSYASAYVKF